MAWVRRELQTLGIPPLKRLGQHFLVDESVRKQLVDLAELDANDTVIEAGPGLGFLTAMLADKAGQVIAIEKDRTLATHLKNKFSRQENVRIMQGDALKVEIPLGAKIVSSPPYNISSKLVLLIANSTFQTAALLLQSEFVSRLTASSGTREYGRISVMLQSKAQATLHVRVPRSAFYPRPRVDSALVRIIPLREKNQINDQELFVDLVRALFSQRRRKLKGVLNRYLKARYPKKAQTTSLGSSLIDKRVYELSPSEFISLANEIADKASEPGT